MAPAAPRLIERGDLLAVLDRAAARKVTVISAPAGSGKTSLLRTWADRPGQSRRLALVQVQRDQQDAQQFWLALLDAVRHATGASSGAEPPPATPDFNASAMAGRVLSEFADARGGITLVIDDLHELNSPEALAQLTGLLTNLPPQVHAILAMRHDVRLRLHQLRLADELAEIRAADLRFTERETRELLAASGIMLSEAGAMLLHQRTEGWAAGLRLAVISLAGHPDPERFVAEFSGSDRTVAEYLLAEMLERQSPEVQDLLLRTSLLDRVNGELADLLTGRPGSEQILLELEDANAFVESLGPERAWFRYHHLLADFLRLELRRTLPAEVPVLHQMAAEWFIRQGQVVNAIRHTQAAGDWTDAARLLVDHSFSLTLDGQAQTMQALVRSFPPGGDHPELALVRAGGDLVQGRLDEAGAHLAALDDERASSGEIGNVRAVICLAEGDPAGALAALHDVLDGTAPVLGYVTLVEAHLLEALHWHQTAHAALLADILDVLHGSPPAAKEQSALPSAEELSPSELRVLRYLPTNLSRPEIAGELSVSPNTVSAHIRHIYAKLQVRDRSSAVRRARELRLLGRRPDALARR